MNKAEKELAGHYKNEDPEMYAGWKDEDVISFNKVEDPDFVETYKVFSGGPDTVESKPKGLVQAAVEGFYGRSPKEDASYKEKLANLLGDVGLPTALAAPFSPAPPVAAAVFAGARGVQLGARQLLAEVGQVMSPGSERLAEKPGDTLLAGAEPVLDVLSGTASQLFGDKIIGPAVGKVAQRISNKLGSLSSAIGKKLSPYAEKLLNQFPNSKFLLTEAGRKESISTGTKQAAEAMEWLDLQRLAINKRLGFREALLGGKRIDYHTKFGKTVSKDIDVIGKAAKAPLVDAKNEILIRVADLPESEEFGLAELASKAKEGLVGRVNLPDDSTALRLLGKYSGLGGRINGTGVQGTKAFGGEVLNTNTLKQKVSVKEMMQDFSSLGEASSNLMTDGLYSNEQVHALNQFKEQLGDRIQERLEAGGQSVVSKAWKENRAGWGRWFKTFRSKTAVKLQGMSPDKVYDHIVSGEVTAQEAKAILHPNTWQTIKQAKVADILGELKGSGDAKSLLVEKYSKGYLENIFDPAEVKYIEDIAKLGDAGTEINSAIDNLMAGRQAAVTTGRRVGDTTQMPRRSEELALGKASMFQNYAGNAMLGGVILNEAVGSAFGVKIPRPYLMVMAAVGLGPKGLAHVYLKGGAVGQKALTGTFKALGSGVKGAADLKIKELLKIDLDITKREQDTTKGLGKLASLSTVKKDIPNNAEPEDQEQIVESDNPHAAGEAALSSLGTIFPKSFEEQQKERAEQE